MRRLSHASQLPVLVAADDRRDMMTSIRPPPQNFVRIGRISRLPTVFADPLSHYHDAALAGDGIVLHQIELRA